MKTWMNGMWIFGLVLGCSGTPVTLSARSGARQTATATGALSSALALNNGIALDRVRIVIQSLKLEAVAQPSGSQPSSGSAEQDKKDGEEEIQAGPFLVDLAGSALDGGITKVFDAAVPAGDYKQVKFKIHKLEDKDAQGHPELADLAAAKASVILDGTIDGAAFSFVSALDEEQEREDHIKLASGQNNITLNIDPSGWFKDAAGARLDPRVDTNRSQIESNIKKSIDTFEDDDHDGKEDAEAAKK